MSKAIFRVSYDDQQGSVNLASGLAALAFEQYRDVVGANEYFFRHDQNDLIYLKLQFSHRKKLATNIGSLHLHHIPMADPGAAQNVYFEVQYVWTNAVNGAVPALSGWTTVNSTLQISPGDVYKTGIHALVSNITYPASENYSSIFRAIIRRLGTSGSDTYTTAKDHGTPAANLLLDYLDAHFVTSQAGSLRETSD